MVVCQRPSLELDVRRFSPKIVEAWETARRAVAEETKARVSLDVTPAGSLVYIDGIALGETPTIVELYQGKHLLFVSAEGAVPLTRSFDVVAGSYIKIKDALPEHRSHALARQLLAEARDRGRKDALQALARPLAHELDAACTILVGVVPLVGGNAVIAFISTDPSGALVTTVPSGLDSQSPAFKRLAVRIRERIATPTAATEHLRMPDAPAFDALLHGVGGDKLDFDTYALGLPTTLDARSPTPIAKAVPAAGGADSGPGGAALGPPESEETEPVSPAFVASIGGASALGALLLGTAASASAAAWYLAYRQRPVVIEDQEPVVVVVAEVAP
jgi:hypothetical protein